MNTARVTVVLPNGELIGVLHEWALRPGDRIRIAGRSLVVCVIGPSALGGAAAWVKRG